MYAFHRISFSILGLSKWKLSFLWLKYWNYARFKEILFMNIIWKQKQVLPQTAIVVLGVKDNLSARWSLHKYQSQENVLKKSSNQQKMAKPEKGTVYYWQDQAYHNHWHFIIFYYYYYLQGIACPFFLGLRSTILFLDALASLHLKLSVSNLPFSASASTPYGSFRVIHFFWQFTISNSSLNSMRV